MFNRRAKLISAAALVAAIALSTASAEAQYLTRHYYRTGPILHPGARAYYNAQAYYGAQAYASGGINVLPVTTVLPMIDGIYDPYDDPVWSCCGRNKDRIGLVGNAIER